MKGTIIRRPQVIASRHSRAASNAASSEDTIIPAMATASTNSPVRLWHSAAARWLQPAQRAGLAWVKPNGGREQRSASVTSLNIISCCTRNCAVSHQWMNDQTPQVGSEPTHISIVPRPELHPGGTSAPEVRQRRHQQPLLPVRLLQRRRWLAAAAGFA